MCCPYNAGIINEVYESLVFSVYDHGAQQRRSNDLVKQFFVNVQLENMYQFNYEIAVNIAGYTLSII